MKPYFVYVNPKNYKTVLKPKMCIVVKKKREYTICSIVNYPKNLKYIGVFDFNTKEFYNIYLHNDERIYYKDMALYKNYILAQSGLTKDDLVLNDDIENIELDDNIEKYKNIKLDNDIEKYKNIELEI
jgi:hypothetical protein